MLVGKPEKIRPLGRLRHIWIDDIETDLKGIGCDVKWIHVTNFGML
jgi:hypothetical protein